MAYGSHSSICPSETTAIYGISSQQAQHKHFIHSKRKNHFSPIFSKCHPDGRTVCEDNVCLIDNDLIHNVNRISGSLGWTARNYSEFWGRKYQEGLDLRLGTFEPTQRVKSMSKLSNHANPLPTEFNSLDQWSEFISPVRDQGWCASSWAVSTASVASDRYAIHSKGKEMVTLSPQHLLSCVRRQRGCSGGHLDWAWNYFRKIG